MPGLVFTITNSRTTLQGADSFILDMLDKELRYPTDLALDDNMERLPFHEEKHWDGWVRHLHRTKTIDPWFATGLYPLAERIAKKFGYAVRLNDMRIRPEQGFPELVNIPLRDYQKEVVQKAIALGRGVIDIPPRGGKTRIMVEVHRRLALPTVWIAPTDRIVRQTKEVVESFFGKNYVTHLVGSAEQKQAATFSLVVCTAATAAQLDSDFFKTREVLIIDEHHHSAARSYTKIFNHCDHIYFRYGMTGTFFRSGNDTMAMHSLLSNTISKITSKQLLDMGYLVPTYAVFVPVKAKRLRGVGGSSYHVGHGKLGIHEHEYRNSLIADCALTLQRAGRHVLILVGTKTQGRILKDLLAPFFPKASGTEFSPVEFVYSSVDRNIQGRVLESFNQGQEVKILIGTSLVGEGVDLPSADALVYARGEQAEVSLVQNVYRTATKTEGKSNAIVVDFADRHNAKLFKHSNERLKIYYEEPTFKLTVLKDASDFRTWLAGIK